MIDESIYFDETSDSKYNVMTANTEKYRKFTNQQGLFVKQMYTKPDIN